jgi:uncharacterized protein (TIGR03000 family)
VVVVRQPVVVQQQAVAAVPARPAADPALTPRSEAERAAVRDALKKVREDSEVRSIKASNSARVIVKLPSDARLFVDNVLCNLPTGTRAFNTPALETGRKYYYTLRTELNRDGRTISQSQRVIVTAGQRVNVTFTEQSVATAQNEE